MAARQGVDLESEDQAHYGVGQRIAYARGVREQEIALQELELVVRNASLRQQAESRIDAVCRIAAGDYLVDTGTGDGNAAAIVGRQAQRDRLLVNAAQRRQRQLAGAHLQDI